MHVPHELGEHRAHHEGRHGEAGHHHADRPGRKTDARAVDRHQEAVDVPSHVEEPARDERVAQQRQAQQPGHAARALARDVRRPRQRALAPREQHDADHRQQGERQHRAGMAECLDGVAGDQRSD